MLLAYESYYQANPFELYREVGLSMQRSFGLDFLKESCLEISSGERHDLSCYVFYSLTWKKS